ncbi:MAG: hypothetical protein EA406_13205 [Rhodospirillales bacterium]|nr:MAG: hypothetical protein EA406_13205 [Rhodospirillales bacterium]
MQGEFRGTAASARGPSTIRCPHLRCPGPADGMACRQCGLRWLAQMAAESRMRLASLSQRERQVLDGLVADKPNKVIAHDLGISPRTVEIFRARVMRKMGARGIAELTRMSIAARFAGAPRSGSGQR